MSPRYNCTYYDSMNPELTSIIECSKEQICSPQNQQILLQDNHKKQDQQVSEHFYILKSWSVNWDSKHSLDNWITWLDLHCEDSYSIALFGSLYFAGFLISCLIFPPLSDKYGRRNLFMLGGLFQLIIIATMLNCKSQQTQYYMIFALGFAQPIKSMIAYTHLMEFVPGLECKISGIFMFLDGLVIVITPFLIHLISQDLNFLFIAALSLNSLSIFLFIITRIPESTKFLLLVQNYKGFDHAIRRIQVLGGISESKIYETLALAKVYEIQQRSKQVMNEQLAETKWDRNTIERIRGSKSITINLILMTFSWCCVSFSYFMISFYIKYLPGDIYQNQSVSGLSAFAFLFAGPISRKLDNKITLTLSFFIAAVGSITMIIFQQMNIAQNESLSVFILLIRAGLNLAFCLVFVIHTQLFPPNFLATSYGICNFFCRSVTLLAPMVAEVKNKDIPMFTLFVACLIGTVSSISLRQRRTKSDCLIEDEMNNNTHRDRLLSASIIK
eukprot:403366275